MIALVTTAGPSSKIQTFLWPDGFPGDAAAPWLDQSQRTALWWGLCAFAVLDVVGPLPVLSASWWCAFLVLWVTPWRKPVCSGVPYAEAATWFSSVLLFSWLIYRTQIAVTESLHTWMVLQSSPWWRLLSFPMQATLAAVVTAAFTAMPLKKLLGDRATTAAIAASIPYAISVVAHTVLVPSRWAEQPLTNVIYLYNAVMPVLVIGEVSSLLGRSSLSADEGRMYGRGRAYVWYMLTGRLNVTVALLGYGGALALVACCVASQQRLSESLTGLVTYAALFPTSVSILGLAALGAWRSLARAGMHHVFIDNMATFGRVAIVATTGGIGLLALFQLPYSGAALSEAVQRLPGPAWSINTTRGRGGLRLSGELQHGISKAFAKALARDPNIRHVELDSPGGDTEEGFALAKLIEQHSLSTVVKNTCASACTLAFIGGRERVLTEGGKLGFHRAQSLTWDGVTYDDDAYNKRIVDYLRSRGIQDDFSRKAYRVPNSNIWYPSVDELLAAGVITTKPFHVNASQ